MSWQDWDAESTLPRKLNLHSTARFVARVNTCLYCTCVVYLVGIGSVLQYKYHERAPTPTPNPSLRSDQ